MVVVNFNEAFESRGRPHVDVHVCGSSLTSSVLRSVQPWPTGEGLRKLALDLKSLLGTGEGSKCRGRPSLQLPKFMAVLWVGMVSTSIRKSGRREQRWKWKNERA